LVNVVGTIRFYASDVQAFKKEKAALKASILPNSLERFERAL
jgi:hypothetical protein